MKQNRIPLYNLKLSRAAIREANETLSTGWLASGAKVQAFENEIASLSRVRYASAVNSATTGLIVGMKAVGVKGGEVVTTPFSFVATAEAVFHCGAVPVFADIDPETLNIDPDQVARRITKKTVCILPVDIAGYPADYAPLRHLAKEHSLPLIADASHALGATYNGKTIPQLTDAAVFSFHATKNLTCGEGGMVLSRQRRIIEEVRLLVRHGVSANAYQRKLKGALSYDVTRLGHKGNLSEVLAAVGLGGLPSFEKNQARRKKLFERYNRNLGTLSKFVKLPPAEKHVRPSWHLYIVKLCLSRLKIDRNRFIELMARRGIECGVHFTPIPEFSFYRAKGYSLDDLPNTTRVGREVVTLPLFPELRLSEVDDVCGAMAEILKKFAR
jgi:dTDP-4-amino-4,6-dideoxygalactose transaminase